MSAMADELAQPAPGVALCELAALDDPGARGFVFSVDGASFAGFVVRRGEGVCGYVDSCPHVGAPLAPTPTGYLTRGGDHIICSTHGALFRLDDGRCVAGPCAGKMLRPWAVDVQDGWVRTA